MSIRWLEWGQEAFSRARAEGKPILLSLTASWCHACHRMDDETWGDPGVAAAVERAAIPVRVDADSRPDLYGCYHLGGLPTTALLSADGGFIRGGTFLSPAECLAFLETALADAAAGRRPPARVTRISAPPVHLVDEVVERLCRRADREHGGFGLAPKLPEAESVTLLLRRWRAAREPALESIVRLTLDAIARHLGDPVDGGFFRYAAAPDWTAPHTEKLAVDQGALIRLFLEAASALGEPRHVEVARRALAHARRRLADEAGRVLASVAAEPAYYTRRAAAMSPQGEEARPPADVLDPEGSRASAMEAEDLPPVDRRRFADAGAAMASAALLGLAVTGEDWGFQWELPAAAPDGAVPHRLDAPADPVKGLLRDQALAIHASVYRYRLTGDARSLRFAELVAQWSLEHLWDAASGVFLVAPAPGAATIPLPPLVPLLANGEMALALIELADHGDPARASGLARWRAMARRLVDALAARAVRSPAGSAVGLAALRLAEDPAKADLSGDPADPRARALARAVVGALGPTAVVRWQPARAPSMALCIRDLCLPPLDSPDDLLQSLIDLELVPEAVSRFGKAAPPLAPGCILISDPSRSEEDASCA